MIVDRAAQLAVAADFLPSSGTLGFTVCARHEAAEPQDVGRRYHRLDRCTVKDSLVAASKFMSYVLRHRPGTIGLTFDPEGWVDLAELVRQSTPLVVAAPHRCPSWQ